MKLKEFFLALARNGHKVEIYYHEEGHFGFKINDIDSYHLSDEKIMNIGEEIDNIFLDDSNIHDLEGSTTYLLHKDGTDTKTASYFDHQSEFDKIWIKENYNKFNFGKTSLPINYIVIEKKLNSFIVDNATELKQFLNSDLYEKFYLFYEELLNQFKEITIELEVYADNKNNIVSKITIIEGSYTITEKFTLMDCSKLDFNSKMLKETLIKCYKFNIEDASLIVT
jgi:hypothetical protein